MSVSTLTTRYKARNVSKMRNHAKMNLLFIWFLLACTEAKRRPGDIYTGPYDNLKREGYIMPNNEKDDGHDDPLGDLAYEKLPKKPFQANKEPEGFGNPRDEYLFEMKSTAPPDEPDGPMWFDFPKLQERNMVMNNNKRKKQKAKPNPPTVAQTVKEEVVDQEAKSKYFRHNSYELAGNPYQDKFKENWTTCDEFAKGASFHPEDIINNEWVPFYIWSYRNFLSVGHTFSFPPVKLVHEYKAKYGPLMDKPIDWEEPKLLMRTVMWDTLLIAVGRTGKYYGVIGQELPDYVKRNKVSLPTLELRLKIEDPYLALMHCDEDQPYALIMAVAGQEPEDDREKREAADTLEFKGRGLPVERDTEYERNTIMAKKMMPIIAKKMQRIYLDRPYGVLGPDEDDEPVQEAKPKSIVPGKDEIQ